MRFCSSTGNYTGLGQEAHLLHEPNDKTCKNIIHPPLGWVALGMATYPNHAWHVFHGPPWMARVESRPGKLSRRSMLPAAATACGPPRPMGLLAPEPSSASAAEGAKGLRRAGSAGSGAMTSGAVSCSVASRNWRRASSKQLRCALDRSTCSQGPHWSVGAFTKRQRAQEIWARFLGWGKAPG
jgi:hypothetical protein